MPRWIRRQLTDAAVLTGATRATFPSALPLLRLDRAYVGSAVRVLGCAVHDSRLARLASDHLPVLVDLEVEAAARRPPPAAGVQGRGISTVIE